jgi:hypothetical protein
VPDNPRVAVIKASFYDPQVNRTCGEMTAHYDTAVLPARPYKPRDKPKVEEAAVRIVERWLLGRLRNHRFHSLAEVRAAIAEMLVALNDRRVMRHVGRTRCQLFEEIDAPKLKALLAEPYVLADWRPRKVGLDYHIDIDQHFCSVPHAHARAAVEARSTVRAVQVFRRPADRHPHAWLGRRQAHHLARAHTLQSSPVRRLGPGAHPARSRRCRSLDADAVRDDHRAGPTPNRASAPALGSCAWPRASEWLASRRPACAAFRSARATKARSGPSHRSRKEANALRQKAYRARMRDVDGPMVERLKTVVDPRAKRALERLARHFGVTQSDALERMIAEAEPREIAAMEPSSRHDHYRD